MSCTGSLCLTSDLPRLCCAHTVLAHQFEQKRGFREGLEKSFAMSDLKKTAKDDRDDAADAQKASARATAHASLMKEVPIVALDGSSISASSSLVDRLSIIASKFASIRRDGGYVIVVTWPDHRKVRVRA